MAFYGLMGFYGLLWLNIVFFTRSFCLMKNKEKLFFPVNRPFVCSFLNLMHFTCFWTSKKLLQRKKYVRFTKSATAVETFLYTALEFATAAEKILYTSLDLSTVRYNFFSDALTWFHNISRIRFSSRPGGYKGSIDRKWLIVSSVVISRDLWKKLHENTLWSVM